MTPDLAREFGPRDFINRGIGVLLDVAPTRTALGRPPKRFEDAFLVGNCSTFSRLAPHSEHFTKEISMYTVV